MGRGDKIGESGGRCRPLAGLHTRRRFMPWKWYTIGNERETCIGTRPVNTAGAVLTYASNSLTRLQRIHATTDILARQANPIRYLALKYMRIPSHCSRNALSLATISANEKPSFHTMKSVPPFRMQLEEYDDRSNRLRTRSIAKRIRMSL